jgi:transcriptional regulator with XRE-family HTH domain
MTVPGCLNKEQPWKPADATDCLRAIAKADYEITLTDHALEQMEMRDLLTGDVTHILKHGMVYDASEPATRPGYHKYKMECSTPNSGARSVRIVVIPSVKPLAIKVVTIMWVDE